MRNSKRPHLSRVNRGDSSRKTTKRKTRCPEARVVEVHLIRGIEAVTVGKGVCF